MKVDDAVKIDTPGESAHGLIGNVTRINDKTAEAWVYLKENNAEWKYRINELVAVKPKL